MKTRHKHYLLESLIKKLGVSEPKRHGAYYNLQLKGFKYHLDDYNHAIRVNDIYYGMDFGGFESNVDEFTYRYHIGLLAVENMLRI